MLRHAYVIFKQLMLLQHPAPEELIEATISQEQEERADAKKAIDGCGFLVTVHCVNSLSFLQQRNIFCDEDCAKFYCRGAHTNPPLWSQALPSPTLLHQLFEGFRTSRVHVRLCLQGINTGTRRHISLCMFFRRTSLLSGSCQKAHRTIE